MTETELGNHIREQRMGGLSEQRHRRNGEPYTYHRTPKRAWAPSEALQAQMLAVITPGLTSKQQCDAAIQVAFGDVGRSRDRQTTVRKWVRAQGLPYFSDKSEDKGDLALMQRCMANLRIAARWAKKVTQPEEDANAATA